MGRSLPGSITTPFRSIGDEARRRHISTTPELAQESSGNSYNPTRRRHGSQVVSGGISKSLFPWETEQNRPGNTIFGTFGRGLETTRDAWVYNFDRNDLESNVRRMIEAYNDHVHRWTTLRKRSPIDDFVDNDLTRISWSSSLKQHLTRGREAKFNRAQIRTCLYRPFSSRFVYFDELLNHRTGWLSRSASKCEGGAGKPLCLAQGR